MARATITGLPHTSHLPPGNSAYSAGCRCDECRQAKRAYQAACRSDGPRQQPYRPHTPKSETEEWKADGACRQHPEVDFFPGRGERVDPAKRICAECAVRRECLEYALTPPKEKLGIWGGTSENDRRKITLAAVVGRPLPPVRFTDGFRVGRAS